MAKGQPRVGATGYEAAPLTALQRRYAGALVSGPDDSYAAGRAVAKQLSAPTCAACCWCAMA